MKMLTKLLLSINLFSQTRENDIEQLRATIVELKEDQSELLDYIHENTPRRLCKVWKKNESSRGGRMVWPNWVMQLVVELLANRTPPSCVAPNILSVVEILFPGTELVKELPGMSVNREARGLMSYNSKCIAAYVLAKVENYRQLFTDGTSRKHISVQNLIIGYMEENGYKTTVLDSAILADDETSESVTLSIIKTFKEGASLLQIWRNVTERMYPGRDDLMKYLPLAAQLNITKLIGGGSMMTDTCNAAKLVRKLLIEGIKQVAREEGYTEEEVVLFEQDCWRHLANVWFGAVMAQMSKTLDEVLEADLKEIPFQLRVGTDIIQILRATEKYFGGTCNYHKGDGRMFTNWMGRNHPGSYLFPLARACGGSRQDLGVEGAPAVLWNIVYYVPFLHWRLSAGLSDSILMKNLYIILRSVEMIGLLRVLSILYFSICLPIRWLAGNAHNLAEYGFSALHMGEALDLMNDAFKDVVNDGKLLLDEDFIMHIFDPISKRVPPFDEYMTFMFEEKEGNVVGSTDEEDRVVPYDLIRCECFYPERIEIVQTGKICETLAVEAAATFLAEFCNKSKATSTYLSEVAGVRSQAKLSKEELEGSLGLHATNNVSESLHGGLTGAIQTWNGIRFDHAAGEATTRKNNDVGRGHQAMISGRKGRKAPTERVFGTLHQLPPELRESLFQAARENVKEYKQSFDAALRRQEELKRKKEEIALEHKLDKAKERYIESIYFYEQYHSPRCWSTAEMATREYDKLPSEAQRFKYCREQIEIRWKGLGWKEAHHAWSRDGVTFRSEVLFDFLIDTVIPLADELEVPSESPVDWPEPPSLNILGTLGDHAKDLADSNTSAREKLKAEANDERDRRETVGRGDRWYEKQPASKPTGKELIGFQIEMMFEFADEDGSPYLDWCHGVVKRIVNKDKNIVEIHWDDDSPGTEFANVTKQVLVGRKWNPATVCNGCWRQYLTT